MRSPYDTGRFAEVTGLDEVSTPADVVGIVGQMLADLRGHPGAWENSTLDDYLDALAGCFEAIPPTPADPAEQAPDPLTWKLFAEALVKATGYE